MGVKGKTNNPSGRPKGTPNKITGEIRELLRDVIGNEIQHLQERLEALSDETRLSVVVKLLPFVTPKLRSVEHRSDSGISTMTTEEIDIEIRELLDNYEEGECQSKDS